MCIYLCIVTATVFDAHSYGGTAFKGGGGGGGGGGVGTSRSQSCDLLALSIHLLFYLAFIISAAAKVSVATKYESIINGCNFTLYDVTVLQSFNTCTVPSVPAVPLPVPNATLTTSDNHCGDVCVRMVPGQVYWVAGLHGSVRGVPTWNIPRFKGVAALWVAKYDEKGPDWLLHAMNQRGCGK